jgi:hypothetical protein
MYILVKIMPKSTYMKLFKMFVKQDVKHNKGSWTPSGRDTESREKKRHIKILIFDLDNKIKRNYK